MTNSEAISLLMNSQYYKQGYKQGVSDVLDKIRAEIEQMPSELTADGRRMIRRESVFRIIEKYKAEGSEKK